MINDSRPHWFRRIAGWAAAGIVLANVSLAETITLAWEAPSLTPAVGYRVYGSRDLTDPFVLVASSDTTYAKVTTAGSAEGYRYYVTALNSEGAESTPSNVIEIGKTLTFHVEPDLLAFEWNDYRYVLETAPTLDGPWTIFANISPAFSDSSNGMGFFRLTNF